MKELPLKHSEFKAIISDEDYEQHSKSVYSVNKVTGYVYRIYDSKYLHRLIMGATDYSETIDHIDRNKLNNTRENLRFVTMRQSIITQLPRVNKTTSKFKGVYLNKSTGKFLAQIRNNYKRVTLLCSTNEFHCAYAYNLAANILGQGFAYLNDLSEFKLLDSDKHLIELKVCNMLRRVQ